MHFELTYLQVSPLQVYFFLQLLENLYYKRNSYYETIYPFETSYPVCRRISVCMNPVFRPIMWPHSSWAIAYVNPSSRRVVALHEPSARVTSQANFLLLGPTTGHLNNRLTPIAACAIL